MHHLISISDIKTDKDLRAYVASLNGLTVKKIDGEYRVAYKDGSEASREASAYYTTDRHDAAGTALAMERL